MKEFAKILIVDGHQVVVRKGTEDGDPALFCDVCVRGVYASVTTTYRDPESRDIAFQKDDIAKATAAILEVDRLLPERFTDDES